MNNGKDEDMDFDQGPNRQRP